MSIDKTARETAPLIVIGAARSGTKFVRDVLSTSSEFARVPYDVNFVWRSSQPALSHDQLDPAHLTASQAGQIRTMLDRVSRRKPGQRLIEKTVSNTLRIPFVCAVYPDAQFIHLIRDGRAVAESSMRMWTAPPDKRQLLKKLHNLPLSYWRYPTWFVVNYLRGRALGRSGGRVWGPRYPGIDSDIESLPIERIVSRQWTSCVEAATRDLAALPAGRVFEVRYEDLVANPEVLDQLCQFARVANPTAVKSKFSEVVDRTATDKWRAVLTQGQVEAIGHEQSEMLEKFGYQ
jgi:hypothetical protein